MSSTTESAAFIAEQKVDASSTAQPNNSSGQRFAVSSVDFSRVETPIIISIWILSASVAKIGELILSINFL